MKLAILAGEIPPMTFILRLIDGLAKQEAQLLVLGSINKKIENKQNVRYLGEKKYSGSLSKLVFRNKYKLLLFILRNRQYKKLRNIKKNADALDYALLWHLPEMVHIQWAKSVENFIWVKQFGVKLVLSLRGAHINYSPITVDGLAEKYQRYFPLIDGFHGVSNAICHEAAKYGADLEKCKTIYSGFNLSEFLLPTNNTKYQNVSNRQLNIISVGRIHWIKGYSIALDAMFQLKKQGVIFKYTLVAGFNEEIRFQIKQLELEDHVEMYDKLPFEKVKTMIQSADVLLLPSVEEGIANVVIEGMLLGTIVITTDCGGMSETVTHGKTGWVVPLRDAAAITQAIVEVHNSTHETLERMIQSARKKAEVQHNEELMVNNMMALYKSVSIA